VTKPSGVEVISAPNGLDIVAPTAIKLREPGLLWAVPAGVKIITRPRSEGLDSGAIYDGFSMWHNALKDDPRWLLHEISNEIQHPNHDAFWAAKGGIGAYRNEATVGFSQIASDFGPNWIARCALGGLRVPQDLTEVLTIYTRLQDDFSDLKRCAHVYWQGANDEVVTSARINDAIWDGKRQLGFRPGYISEYGDSGSLEIAVRVNRCKVAHIRMHEEPLILGDFLFANDPWQDPDGIQHAFSPAQQHEILYAVPQQPEPVPLPPGGVVKPTADEAHHIWNRFMSLRAIDFVGGGGYNPVTAFAKQREKNPELGMPITGEDQEINTWQFQCFAGGVIVAPKSDVNKTWVAHTRDEVLAGPPL